MYKGIAAFILLFVALFSKQAAAQDCQWISVSYNSYLEEIQTVTTDNNNDIIAGGNYFYKLSIDTFQRGTSNYTAGLIIKYTPDGDIKWVYNTTTTFRPNSVQAGAGVWKVKTDAQNNIYALCNMAGLGTVNFGNGYSVTTYSYTDSMVLIKLNANGILQWMKTVAFTSNSTVNYQQYALTVDTKGNAIVGYNSFDYIPPVDKYSEGFHLAKYSPQGNIILSKSFFYKNALIFDLDVDKNDNVFILGHADSSYVFGGNTLSPSGGVLVLKTDSLFNPLIGFQHNFNNNPFKLIPSNNQKPTAYFAVNDDAVALGGIFKGTADFGNKTLTATNSSNIFLAYYASDFSLKWVKADSTEKATAGINNIYIRNNYISGAGVIAPSLPSPTVKFGGHIVNVIPSYINLLILRADTVGNVLWVYNSANANKNYACDAHANSIAVDSAGDCVIGGAFATNPNTNSPQHYVTVFNRIASGSAQNIQPDLFVAKIAANSVTRGNVYPGPYCAGDTISIPYTKSGKYEPGNQFIAQLSDNAGNFDGGERELGRITDTAGGVIKGILPMFNVATSKNYRIRILSTKPQVQSFYRKDNLHLLIYSRDTADAGPDRLICKGQNVQLSVTGGTRWWWTPTAAINNPADSGRQHVVVSPSNTIDFRVIISDSSGCGCTDTDFVRVMVRPPVLATINAPASICRGSATLLSAAVTGGNPSGYNYTWQQENGASFTTIKTGKQADVQASPFVQTRYRVIVNDSCTTIEDTAYFILNIDTVITITPPADTTICKGHKAMLTAHGNGCDSSRYSYVWTVKNNPTVVAAGQTVSLSPASTNTYIVILRDTVGKLYDTAEVTVFVDEMFTLKPSKDTTICVGQNVLLAATVLSCDTTGIKYSWTLANSPTVIGSTATFMANPLVTEEYRVIAKSAVNGLADSGFVKVIVRPALSVKITGPDTVCAGKLVTLTAALSGGNIPNHSLVWTADSRSWTSTQNPVTDYPPTKTTYTATLADNCSPAAKDNHTVTVIPAPKADFDITNTAACEPVPVLLTDKSTAYDTTLNKWWFGAKNTATGVTAHTEYIQKNGSYIFGLSVANRQGCTDSISKYAQVIAYKLPYADFIVKPDIKEAGRELMLINNSSSGSTYIWDMGDGSGFTQHNLRDTAYTYADSGTWPVRLVVQNVKGCRDTLTRFIKVFDMLHCIVPNAFTPNGDGINNTFAPMCSGVKSYTLTIFNRWGQIIHECENCAWDGKFGDWPVEAGAYMYLLKVKAESGKKETVYGMVDVMR